MKSRTVTTITSNDELVRQRIFDGVIPLGDAGAELLQMALNSGQRLDQIVPNLNAYIRNCELHLRHQRQAADRETGLAARIADSRRRRPVKRGCACST